LKVRAPENKIQEEGQTHLVSTAVTTDNSNCQKNLSSASGEICDVQKPAVHAVVAVPDKNSNENVGNPTETLIPHEPIHYHILPSNEPHPCDKYGCPREAKYQLGNSHYATTK